VAVVATLSKGYDLDYIWKNVDRGPAKDAASYYIQASESGGEPPGRWWGPGARALGLEPGEVVERTPYELLFGERKAPDGTRLGNLHVMAAKPPTCTRSCWPPSRTPPPNANANCGPRPSRRPGRVPSSST
jgi:hypothetical protein